MVASYELKQRRLFAGCPKFLRAQLLEDWKYVKHGKPALAKERDIAVALSFLRREMPHTGNVRTLTVRFYIEVLGLERVVELANANLSGFLFKKACDKAIEKVH